MLPMFFSPVGAWSAELRAAMIRSAWERLAEIYGPPSAGAAYPTTVVEAWVVFGVWPLVAVWAGVVVVRRRDV